MSQYGQAHRQLVQDTNQGKIIPDAQTAGTSNTQVTAQQTQFVDYDKTKLAKTLVTVAGEVAKPIVAEQKRKQHRQGRLDAGTEEGKKVIQSATDVWHTQLFGPDAYLKGAQERIAETTADDLYMKASDLLHNGQAASWDDDKWDEWLNEEVDSEVNKYESEEMKDFVSNVMDKNLQRLNRDRQWKNYEYKQVEKRRSLSMGIQKKVSLMNEDLAYDTNPNRKEEDSVNRGEEIISMLKESGASQTVQSQIAAEIAASELQEGRSDFADFAKENGLLDKLTYGNQQNMESARRVYDIKNSSQFGKQYDELMGPQGSVNRGHTKQAIQQVEELYKTHPEAFPQGINPVKNQVRARAWSIAYQKRVQQQWEARMAEAVHTGVPAAMPMFDPATGAYTGTRTATAPEMIQAGQRVVKGEMLSQHFADHQRKNDGSSYIPPTPEEFRQLHYENLPLLAKTSDSIGHMLPELHGLLNDSVTQIQYGMKDGVQGLNGEAFMGQMKAINSMLTMNPRVRTLARDTLGEESYSDFEYVSEMISDGKPLDEIGRRYIGYKEGQHERGGTTPGSKGSVTTAGSGPDERPPEHEMGLWDRLVAFNTVREELGVGFLHHRAENPDMIKNTLADYYAESLAAAGIKYPIKSEIKVHRNKAVSRFTSEYAPVRTDYGYEMMKVGGAHKRAKEAGWESINEYLEHIGEQKEFMRWLSKETGAKFSAVWGNPLTDNGIQFQEIGDDLLLGTVPNKDGGTSTFYLHQPNKDNPDSYPPKIKQDNKVRGLLHKVRNKPDEWKKYTGDPMSPKEEFDFNIAREIAAEKLMASGKGWKDDDGFVTVDREARKVTPEEIKARYPGAEYNAALRAHLTIAVEDAVSKTRQTQQFNAITSNPTVKALGKTAARTSPIMGVYDLATGRTKENMPTIGELGDDIADFWSRITTEETVAKPTVPHIESGQDLDELQEAEDELYRLFELEQEQLRKDAIEIKRRGLE